jgi:hypothetical protein
MRIAGPIWLGRPRGKYDDKATSLRGLSAAVSPEGDTAVFAAELESSQNLHIRVSIEQIGHICSMVRQTAVRMNNRQRLKADLGAEKLGELAMSAERLAGHEMYADPTSGEFLFLYHFHNNAPMVLRVDPRDCLENMAATMQAIRHLTN